MPDDSDWLSYDEIAAMLGVKRERVYNAISNMRRFVEVKTRPNPRDYRETFIHRSEVEAIRRFMRLDDGGSVTA